MANMIDVKKVAQLARLKLTEEEETYYVNRFREIIDYVGLLSDVNINSEMKKKDESMQIIYRDDTCVDSPVSPSQFSDYIEKKFFKVPKIID